MEPLPAEPVMIEYQTPETTPWRPMIRLMILATIAMGVTHSFNWIVNVGWFMALRGHTVSGLIFTYWTIQLAEAGCGAGLAVGGCMAWSNVRHGRDVISIFALVYGTVAVAVQLIYLYGRVYRIHPMMQALGSLQDLVLPALLWGFFRRPEVMAAMTCEK